MSEIKKDNEQQVENLKKEESPKAVTSKNQKFDIEMEEEFGGDKGPEPTRYGTWTKDGIENDF